MPETSKNHGKSQPLSSCGEERSDEIWNFVLLAVAIVFVFTICAIYTAAAASAGIPP